MTLRTITITRMNNVLSSRNHCRGPTRIELKEKKTTFVVNEFIFVICQKTLAKSDKQVFRTKQGFLTKSRSLNYSIVPYHDVMVSWEKLFGSRQF